MASTVAALAAAVWLACNVAALTHQQRARRAAAAAVEEDRPAMTRVEHLARCVSLATPLSGSATQSCARELLSIRADLAGSRRPTETRAAAAALSGAVRASSHPAPALSVMPPDLATVPHPSGGQPRDRARILPREPWAALGTFAGSLLVAAWVWMLGLAPLLGLPAPRRRNARIVAAAGSVLLAALFAAGMWMA